jgi:predicted aspartyl protease
MLLTRRGAAIGLITGAAAALPVTRTWAQAAGGPAQPLAPAAAAPAPDPAADETPTQVGAGRDKFEHLMAPVGINGQGPFNFILDTGANVSCVSGALAEKLALTPAAPAQVHTMVGVRTRPSVLIDTLKVGARNQRRVRAPALPSFGGQVDGVLGIDWLKGQRLVLNFKKKSIEITASRAENSSATRVVVPARRRLGQLTIVDADLSGHRISAMIDSGSQATMCNSALHDLVEKMEAHQPFKREHQLIKMETIAGEPFSGELFYLPFLRLGGLQLGNVPVVYSDAHVFELWGLKTTPAIVLGMDLLTQFDSVALDFGRSQVRFDLA